MSADNYNSLQVEVLVSFNSQACTCRPVLHFLFLIRILISLICSFSRCIPPHGLELRHYITQVLPFSVLNFFCLFSSLSVSFARTSNKLLPNVCLWISSLSAAAASLGLALSALGVQQFLSDLSLERFPLWAIRSSSLSFDALLQKFVRTVSNGHSNTFH